MSSSTENANPDWQAFDRAARLRRWTARLVLVVLVLFFALVAVFAVPFGFVSSVAAGLFSDPGPRIYVYPLLGLLGFVSAPLLLALPLSLPFGLLWRQPRRIVVFRRFNVGRKSAGLGRLLSRDLACCGHVFTLADSGIKLAWFVRFPGLLGQLSFVNFRPRRVDHEEALRRLGELLRSRSWLNVNWVVSLRGIFPISSSDGLWMDCVRLLLEEADLVVVDISLANDTMRWEVTESVQHGLADRMLFVSSELDVAQAQAWLRERAVQTPALAEVPLLTYGRWGAKDRAALRAAAARRLVHPRSERVAPHTGFWKSLAVAVAGAAAVGSVAAFTSAPYLFGRFTALHSPLEWHVYHSYFYGDGGEAALDRLARDYRATATPALLAHAASDEEHLWQKGLPALEKIGDERAVTGLLKLVQSTRDETVPSIFGDRTRHGMMLATLAPILARLGAPGVRGYFVALKDDYVGPWNRTLHEAAWKELAKFPATEFYPMLTSPGQAARFTAGLRLAEENDLRAVPVLLEIARTKDGQEAQRALERFVDQGRGKLDASRLGPALVERNRVTETTARLVVQHASDDELRKLLTGEPPPRALITALVEDTLAHDGGPTRVVSLLAGYPRERLHAELQGDEHRARLDAALVLALRGDAAGLASTLELFEVEEECGWLPDPNACYRGRLGRAILDTLAKNLAENGTFPVPVPDVSRVGMHVVIALTRAVARSGDTEALKGIVKKYAAHPQADRVNAGWPAQDSGDLMARVLPQHLDAWVVRTALKEQNADLRATLEELALDLMSRRCGALYFGNRELVARSRSCLAQ